MATTKKQLDVYHLLRELIVKEKVMPNERLIEADLAVQFSTTRSNIRSALSSLEQEGLVVSEPFKGAKVRSIGASEAIEIFEVRGALETLIIRQAVANATSEDKDRLSEMLEDVASAVKLKNSAAAGQASRNLRQEIWKISNHETGMKMLGALNSQLVRFWYHLSASKGRAETIYKDLYSIVDAIKSGSESKAVKAVTRYHEHSIDALKKAISSKSEFR